MKPHIRRDGVLWRCTLGVHYAVGKTPLLAYAWLMLYLKVK